MFFRAIDRHLVNLQSQCLQFFAKIAQSLTRGQKLSIENRRGNIWQLFKDIGRFLLKPSGHTAAGKRNVSTEKRRAFDRRKTIVQKDLKNKQDNDSKKIFVYLYPDISLFLSSRFSLCFFHRQESLPSSFLSVSICFRIFLIHTISFYLFVIPTL